MAPQIQKVIITNLEEDITETMIMKNVVVDHIIDMINLVTDPDIDTTMTIALSTDIIIEDHLATIRKEDHITAVTRDKDILRRVIVDIIEGLNTL